MILTRWTWSLLLPLLIIVTGNKPADARQSGPSQKLAAANRLCDSGEYDRAVEAYQSLFRQGYVSTALFYNLGYAAYRAKDPGLAVLSYERALLLEPHHADVRYNLELIRASLEDQVAVLRPFFLHRWWIGLRGSLSPAGWAALAWACWALAVVATGLFWLGRNRRQKAYGFTGAIFLLLLGGLWLGLSLDRLAVQQKPGRAVVMAPEVRVHVAPDQASRQLLTLHEGTAMNLVDTLAGWTKIRLANGEEGWLVEDGLERVAW